MHLCVPGVSSPHWQKHIELPEMKVPEFKESKAGGEGARHGNSSICCRHCGPNIDQQLLFPFVFPRGDLTSLDRIPLLEVA